MRYVEMTRKGIVMIAGHLTTEEIYYFKRDGYEVKCAEKVDYKIKKQQQPKKQMRKEKPAVYNKVGVRIG